MGLLYPKDNGFELTAFSDSDHAGCFDSCKSTSGGIKFLGGDKLVTWSSKKQDCTSMSSVEAEYVSLSVCCTQVLWIRTQLTDYGFHFAKIPMYYDSQASIAISCNLVQHSCTKHIDVKYHFIKEHVEKGTNVGVATPFQQSQFHYHVLILKLQKSYIQLKCNKNATGEIVSLDEEEEFTSFQDMYKYVGQEHKLIKKVKSSCFKSRR
ncbi:hypothetical protein Tco_0004378 [Tanacetum coccineum]